MAEKTVTAKENGGKDERKAERVEMAEAVWRNVLDPILTFAELVRGYSAVMIEPVNTQKPLFPACRVAEGYVLREGEGGALWTTVDHSVMRGLGTA